MSYGFQLIGNHGRVQVDQDFKAPRLIASGSSVAGMLGSPNGHAASVTLPYATSLEPPIVLIRPSLADKFVGGFSLDAPSLGFSPSNGFFVTGQCPFDYAVFSSQGTAVSDGSEFGLEVLTASGVVAYSSRHSHPRLRALLAKSATTAADGGYPNNFTISGFSQMPWVLANPLLVTAIGLGPDGETLGCVMAAVNGSFTQLTIDLRNMDPDHYLGAYPRIGAYLSNVNDYNPYYNLPAWFGVATYA